MAAWDRICHWVVKLSREKIMAENEPIDVNELRQWMNENRPMRGNTLVDTAIEYLIDTTWRLLKVVEAQDARIKALEDKHELQ